MRYGVALAMTGLIALSGHYEVSPAFAQAPAAAPAADAAFEAARQAFDALPDGERRAMQNALIWTGDYKGTIDGSFGAGTRAAIVAYARRAKLPADGTLDARARAQLAAAGAKARDGVGFKAVAEPRSGATIGLPTRLLTRRSESPAGARFGTADGSATVDIFRAAEADGDLQALYEKSIAPAPGRRVTYRVLRPDFFVVSGDVNGRVFYTRVARGLANDAPLLRGYTLSYAAAVRAGFDIYGIAMANAFAPFATAPEATAPQAPPVSAGPRPVLAGTAIVVAPARVLAMLPPRACGDAQVAGRKANVIASQAQGGLALLDVPGLTAPALALNPAVLQGDVVTLQLTPRSLVAPAAPGVAPAADLVAAPGQIAPPVSEKGAPRLVAPVQPGANGGAIFNRAGALVGLVGLQRDTPRLVAGIAPQASVPLVDADAAIAYLRGAGVTLRQPEPPSGALTAAEIALRARASILPLVCVQ